MLREQTTRPLFSLILRERWEEVADLIAKGEDVNARSVQLGGRWPLTPLLASLEVHWKLSLVVPADIIRLLVTTDNVNMQCANGWTPLHFAVHYNRCDLVPIFLEKGADVNIRDAEYDTALDVAIRHKAEANIVARLISPQNIHNPRNPIMLTFVQTPGGSPQVLSLLVENGADLGVFDNRGGNTPLHLAFRYLHGMDIITLLISTRHINATNGANYTPLELMDYRMEKISLHVQALHSLSNYLKDLLRMIPIFLERGADPYVLPAHKLPPKPFSLIHFCVISIRRHTSNNAYNRLPLPPKLRRRVEFEDLAQHIVDYYLRVVEAKIGIIWKL